MENLKEANTDFLLEIGLESLHQESSKWISEINLWKLELSFFQKLLDKYSKNFSTEKQRKELDHFQNLITYYNGELLDQFMQKIRKHEKSLVGELKNDIKIDETIYRKKHWEIANEIKSLAGEYYHNKKNFFKFIESVL